PDTHAQDRATIEARARGRVDTLASPAFNGRGYIANGDAIAAEWIARQFQRIGLKPVKKDFFQPFTFGVNSFPDSAGVVIDGIRLTPGVDFLVHPSSGSGHGDYLLVHLTPADLLTPERRSMTMGVISGRAACLWTPDTKDR